MLGLGDNLRRAREERGITLQQAEFETRVRLAILENLENDNLQALPPEPFTRGLLKTYARYLGLDLDLLTQQPHQSLEYGPDALSGNRVETSQETDSPVGPELARFPGPPEGFPPLPEPNIPLPEMPRSVGSTLLSQPRQEGTLNRESAHPDIGPSLLPWPPVADSENSTETIENLNAPEPEVAAPIQVVEEGWKFPVSAEVVAILLILAVIGILSFSAYTRFLGGVVPGMPEARYVTYTPTPSPTEHATAGPTPVRTFVVTPAPPIIVGDLTPAAEPLQTGVAMTLVVQVERPIWLLVMADNREAFRGNLEAGERVWTASSRMYIQVRNIPNAVITLGGRRVQAATFAERTMLERAWILNPRGTPISVQPDQTWLTPGPTLTATGSPTLRPPPSLTATRTLLPTRTPTPLGWLTPQINSGTRQAFEAR